MAHGAGMTTTTGAETTEIGTIDPILATSLITQWETSIKVVKTISTGRTAQVTTMATKTRIRVTAKTRTKGTTTFRIRATTSTRVRTSSSSTMTRDRAGTWAKSGTFTVVLLLKCMRELALSVVQRMVSATIARGNSNFIEI